MAITNKFRVYGENSTNLLSDSAYNDNSVRTGGAQAGQSISSSITNTALKTASIIGIAFIDALGLRNTASTVILGLDDSIADLRDKLKALMDGFVGDSMSSTISSINNDISGLDGRLTTAEGSLSSHIGNTNNPHSVTKAQVGLGNVDNKSAATLKSEFTGSIANGNTGFVTGGDAYTALNAKRNKFYIHKILISSTARTGSGELDFDSGMITELFVACNVSSAFTKSSFITFIDSLPAYQCLKISSSQIVVDNTSLYVNPDVIQILPGSWYVTKTGSQSSMYKSYVATNCFINKSAADLSDWRIEFSTTLTSGGDNVFALLRSSANSAVVFEDTIISN